MAPSSIKKKSNGKRQKTSQDTTTVLPIGSRADAVDKDDEELRLESLLFGTPISSGERKGKGKAAILEPEETDTPDVVGGLDHILDSELFFVDSGEPAAAADSEKEFGDEFDGVGEDSHTDAPMGVAEASSSRDASPIPLFAPRPSAAKSQPKKGPAWVDPSDQVITVSLKDDKRLRKLRDGPDDDKVTGREYELKLRRQFEKINPTPEWTATARKKAHSAPLKRRRMSSASTSESDGDGDEGVESLLHSTGDTLTNTERPTTLPPTKLDILGLRDANQAGRSEGEVNSVRFHPSPTVPVLLTAGSDRRLRLFHIDGLTNPLLQTVHTPNLPISNAQFHPSGSSILLTGNRSYFWSFDLQSGSTTQSPRGLWSAASYSPDGNDAGDRSMEICKFSEDGKLLAVGGRGGYVHLLQCNASGTASSQVVGSLKMNRPLKDLEWCGGPTGKELMTVSGEGEVYIWDVGMRRCLRTWSDDSAFGSTVVARGGSNGKYFAIGAKSGIVNLYGSDAYATSPTTLPSSVKALKSIRNLVHPISTARFDPSCQILAIASKHKAAQLRMVHLPSLTVFANWPTAQTPLGTIMSLDFSAGSEYLAIGNAKGRVLLYNLKHFGAQ